MRDNITTSFFRISLRMVWKEILILSILVLILSAGRINNALSLLLLPLLVAVDYIVDYAIYKKLFYTSVYGDTAPTYMSMPVPVGQMIRGKIGVILLLSVLTYIMNVAGGCIAQHFHEYSQFFDVKEYLLFVCGVQEWSLLPVVIGVTAKMLGSVCGTLFFAMMVFCLIGWYQSFPAGKRRGFFRAVPWIMGIAADIGVSQLIKFIAGFARGSILSELIAIVLYIAATAAIYRYLVRLLEIKYEIN